VIYLKRVSPFSIEEGGSLFLPPSFFFLVVIEGASSTDSPPQQCSPRMAWELDHGLLWPASVRVLDVSFMLKRDFALPDEKSLSFLARASHSAFPSLLVRGNALPCPPKRSPFGFILMLSLSSFSSNVSIFFLGLFFEYFTSLFLRDHLLLLFL